MVCYDLAADDMTQNRLVTKGRAALNEATITSSPYAYVPKENMSDQEIEELYRTRIDETYRPYTVIDVITKVYRRSFKDDLLLYVSEHPEEFRNSEDGWNVSRIWINELQTVHSESVFFQRVENFAVDILVDGRMKIEEVRRIPAGFRHSSNIKIRLRLRYIFDLRPCKLTCRFDRAVIDEEESLQALNKDAPPLDKYLLPVLSAENYQQMATWIRFHYYPEFFGRDVAVDPEIWIQRLGHSVRYAAFPENGALGEYFFSFGTADVIDAESGEVRSENINPGAIILNRDVKDFPVLRRSTLAHEGTHAYLGKYFFLLQKSHGHEYCSYMCKRMSAKNQTDYQSPLERMEIQANTLPRYLMIPEKKGKARAEMLLASYGGECTLDNMQKLVADMAAFYGTTKTMARSRLMDFGYNEVRGILRTVNGNLVPAYYSTLQKNEVYSISEQEAIREYAENPEFRQIVNSDLYLYVRENGCFCRNDSRYIFFDHEGRPHLRRYAREHMTECCLVFREEYENIVVRLVNGILQKSPFGKGRKHVKYVGANGESPVTAEGLALRKKLEREMAQEASLGLSFNDMTVKLMDQRRISVDKLVEKTGLSVDTIKRMRNKTDLGFSIQSIVAVCIALHLPVSVSMDYIGRSPAKFLDGIEMKMYEYALHQWYMDEVPVVNRRLVEAGVMPLTDLVEGFTEEGVKVAT